MGAAFGTSSLALEGPAVSDRIPGPEEQVRRHLARELHDGVVQTLQLMLVEMEQFKVDQIDQPKVQLEVNGYQAYTRNALNELRDLLYGLREVPAVDTALGTQLRALIHSFEKQSGIRSRLSISSAWPRSLPRIAAHNIQRLVEEALNNIRRHSEANFCHVALREQDPATLLLLIRDNGVGLPALASAGYGLTGMRERVLLLGGRLSVRSGNATGTELRAAIPRENLR